MEALESLNCLEISESGLAGFDMGKFQKFLNKAIRNTEKNHLQSHFENHYLEFLNYIIFERFSELAKLMEEKPESVNTLQAKSIRIINRLIQKEEVSFSFIFPFVENRDFESNQSLRFLSRNLSKEVIFQYQILFQNIKNLRDKESFSEVDFYSLKQVLPDIVIFYSDFILKNKIEKKYDDLVKNLSKFLNYEKYEINPEIYRLLAFYYRRVNDQNKAEKMMIQYRSHFKPDLEKKAVINSYGNQIGVKPSETLNSWQSILEECNKLQDEVLIKSGVYKNTCEYFKCTDCCTYTFPVMSLTEFLHLKKWLKENNYPIENIIEKSNKIQEDYKEKYGEDLPIIDKNLAENNIRGIENPHSYRYTCPFLNEEGKCSCYEARPLLCRGFGLSTDNDISIKTCNYYLKQYQYNSSKDNEREVYDLRQIQSLAKQSDKYITKKENGKEQSFSGTIAAWFSSSENNLKC